LKRIFKISENGFVRNVLILLSWTLISQLISLLALPVLSRLYSPESFGNLANFIAVGSILSMISTGKFETAIMLPKHKNDAVSLVFLIMILSLVFSIVFSIIILFLPDSFLNNDYYLFIPVYTFFYGIWISLFSYGNRIKKFNSIGLSKALQSLFAAIFSILLCYNTDNGLILALIIGLFSSLIVLSIIFKKEIFNHANDLENIKKVFKRYINFFKYSTISGVFNSLSNVGLPLLITLFFNSVFTGLYFFSNKIIQIPLNFLFSSLSQVYFQKASGLYNDMSYKKLLALTLKIQKKIALMIIPFLLIMSILSPWIFGLIFGEEWIKAGEYVKYFAFFVLMKSLISPISSLLDIFEKQKLELIFNISLGLSQILGLWIGKSIYNSFDFSLLFISIIGGIHYLLLLIYIVYKLLELSKKQASSL